MKPMPDYNLFQSFSMLLYVIIWVSMAYVWLKMRRPQLRTGLTIIVMITAYLASISDIPEDYGINITQQELMALMILSLSFLTLFYRSQKKTRLCFATATKNQTLRKQKQKCNMCGKGLEKFNIDFDHKNGNRSDNRLSNCRALCTPCHRKKHAIR